MTETTSESKGFPPPGYVQTDSAVTGIDVYMPAPPEPEAHEVIVDFECPGCGGTTAYSAVDGGVTCDYCGYYEAPREEAVGWAAESFEFTAATVARAAQGWGAERQELSCGSCGASTVLDSESLTHTCPFCGSNQVVQREAPQDVLRPRFVVPFEVDADSCRSIVSEWLGSSWKAPSDLRQRARLDDLVGMYLPMWTFSATASADWRAEVGHQVSETFFDDGDLETRWVTEWRWESGHVSHAFEDRLEPGTTEIDPREFEQVGRYELGALVAYDASYLAGVRAQAYDVELEEAWALARAEMREVTREECRHDASTSKIRNFSMKLAFDDEGWRYILAPLYFIVYRYADETYRVVVNGQTGELVGRRPIDTRKQLLAVLIAALPGLALVLIGGWRHQTDGDSRLLIIGIAALMAGVVIGSVAAGAGDD